MAAETQTDQTRTPAEAQIEGQEAQRPERVPAPPLGLGNRATEALLARLRANRAAAMALDRAEAAQREMETGEAETAPPPAETASEEPETQTAEAEAAEQPPQSAETAEDTEHAAAPPETARTEPPEAETEEARAAAERPAPEAPPEPATTEGTTPPDAAQTAAEGETQQAAETAAQAEPQTDTAEGAQAAGPAPTETGTGAAPAQAPADDTGGVTLEPGPQIQAWRARVTAGTQAIETPELPTAGGGGAAVRREGASLRGTRTQRREAITREAEAAVSPPPETEEPLPDPPPDPVPEANQRVEDTAGRDLTPATLPDLEASPRGTQPLVPGAAPRRPPPVETEEPAAAPETPESAAGPETPSDAGEDHVGDIENEAETPAPEVPPGTAEGATITDEPPEPREPLPPMLGNVMREVIARLMVNPRQQATPIVTAARNEAYPNRVLPQAYPEIGNDRLNGLTEALSNALRMIAADAGVAAEDLDAAIERRRTEVEGAAGEAEADIAAAGTEEAEAAEQDSADEVAEVEAAETAQNEHTTAVMSAAEGEASPEVIDRRANDQIRQINRRAGVLKADYTRAKTRFHGALDRAKAAQVRAYDATATEDRRAIAAEEASATQALDQGRTTIWLNRVKRELNTEVTRLKGVATTEEGDFRGDTTAAALEASEMVRTWAETQKGEEESWWDRLWALFSDWSQQAESEAEVWAEVRAGEARDATVGNMMTLNAFVQSQGETVNLETNAAFARLTEEQQAVIRAYYASPPANRDTIGAVAAGLRHRLAGEQKTPLIEAMKSEVTGKPLSEWAQLEQIGRAQRSGFSAERISSQLYDAMFGGVTGWGTDEDQIYNNLSGLTPVQGRAVRGNYNADYGRNLDSDLASELDEDNALIRARAALDGDPVMETVGALNEAMSGIGTDEDTIMRMLRGKTAEQRARIVEEYRRQYGVDLEAELDAEMDDHDQERAEALLAGDTARADAIALDQAMHGGILGWGTDEDQIESVYSDIRNDVSSQQIRDPDTGQMRRMTQAEMEAEVLRRNQEVEASYDDRYGDPNDQESALRAAYADELSGPDLDLANALADNDLVAADAARLERERLGFYTDDDVVNGVLENQYARALDAVERDPATERRRQALRDRAQREGWDPYQLANAERALQRELEQEARVGASENMAALEARYDSKYSRWGSGGLQTMITFNMSGTDRERARTLTQQGGYLSPAQRIDYATRGVGTDEAEFERAMAGRTAAEIAEINRELARMGRPTVQEIARDELDGRDYQDMSLRLRGVPENAEEELRQAELRVQWELQNSPVQGVQRDVMQARLDRMRNQYALINDPDADPVERRRALQQFQARGTGVEAGVDSYRAQVDAVTDAVATTLSLAAAITVTILTGGVAGAVLGALAAAAMSMSVKAGLKGAAYGADEMAVDAVVGIVDAVAAYATFGMGNALLRVATSQGGRVGRLGGTRLASTLSRMAVASSRTQRMFAHGMSEMVEGVAGSLPSALAGNMLNDRNWEQGNPFTNIIGGTLMETGMGAVVSGGMGSLGGFSMPHVDPPTPRTGDILAHRGTPADRVAAWRAHKAENPDADMRSFLRQYDDQVRDRLAAESRDAGIQRELRGELLSGIPPAQRRQFADVPIEVMSEADFRAFTRSDSASAVTIIENGEPRIILRDGAPPGALREEGIHLQQIADPDLGRLARRLDEGRLQDWDSMGLADQLELYTIKIDLEIDAQNRLIAGLRDDIARNADPAQARGLQRQLDLAEVNLRNLTQRAREVADIGPLDRIAMSRGLRDPPDFLDQPPRLFQKDGDNLVADATADAADAAPTRTEVTDSGLSGRRDFNENTDRVQRIGDEDFVERSVTLPRDAQIQTRQVVDGAEVDVTLEMRRGRLVDVATGKTVPHTPPTEFVARGNTPAFKVTGRGEVRVQRRVRQVEVTRTENGVERRLRVQDETRPIRARDLTEMSWRERGTATGAKGEAGELASQMVGRADNRVLATFDVQRADGTGLDSVELILDADGRPVFRLVEAKNYGEGNYVSFEDFTAILFGTRQTSGNLDNNLALLDDALRPSDSMVRQAHARVAEDFPELTPAQIQELGPEGIAQRGRDFNDAMAAEIDRRMAAQLSEALGQPFTVDSYRHALAALQDLSLQPLIRRSPGTMIGQRGSGSAFNRLRRHWGRMRDYLAHLALRGARPDIRAPRHFEDLVDDIPPDVFRDAEAAVRGLDGFRARGDIDAERLVPSDVDGARYMARGATPAGDRFFDVVPVDAGDVAGGDVDALVQGLRGRLDTPLTTASGSHAPLNLIVDLSDLAGDKAAVEQQLIDALRAAYGDRADEMMSRVVILQTRN
ncbi:Carbon monoxide oxidation accessory protein CoxG [Rhodovulum sp. P5]|uniref:annexin n=1 Tax=Rhodovulum sp. P5 TaxID=1564506 RepID=UPI0009C1C77D|nr:annexin [Rhodovulum sp. P5]ARE41813.1 Carbon monoxide oxidation accessory protein CoxG [Rhodovulum sp. P5]